MIIKKKNDNIFISKGQFGNMKNIFENNNKKKDNENDDKKINKDINIIPKGNFGNMKNIFENNKEENKKEKKDEIDDHKYDLEEDDEEK